MAGGYPVAGGCSRASWGGGRQPERTRTTVSGRRGTTRRQAPDGRRQAAGDWRQAAGGEGDERRRQPEATAGGSGRARARPARPLPSAPPHTWGTTATPPVLGPRPSAHGLSRLCGPSAGRGKGEGRTYASVSST